MVSDNDRCLLLNFVMCMCVPTVSYIRISVFSLLCKPKFIFVVAARPHYFVSPVLSILIFWSQIHLFTDFFLLLKKFARSRDLFHTL